MIIPRSEWSPKHGRGHATPRAQSRVVIHHAPERSIRPNPTREQVAEQLRIIEDWHAERLTPSNPRIGYQFVVVDQTSEIWEGLGWARIGAHVANNNTPSLGVLILGINGDRSTGRTETWRAIARLIQEGIRLGHLVAADQLIIEPHRARVATHCPGNALAAFVEQLTVPELLQLEAQPVPVPQIPEPSGGLAVRQPELVTPPALEAITPRLRQDLEEAAMAQGFDPRRMSGRDWARVIDSLLLALQLAGVPWARAAAEGIERIRR